MTQDERREGASEAHEPTRKKSVLSRLLKILQWTASAVVVLALVYVFTPVGDWIGHRLIVVDPLAEADYIVVLGGDRARAVEAANLFRRGWAKKVIFSSHDEGADDLAATARAYGLPAAAVLLDRQAARTASHPRTVAQLPGVRKDADRFIILTSPYHTARVRGCFMKAGYRNIIMRGLNWRRGGQFAPPLTTWQC